MTSEVWMSDDLIPDGTPDALMVRLSGEDDVCFLAIGRPELADAGLGSGSEFRMLRAPIDGDPQSERWIQAEVAVGIGELQKAIELIKLGSARAESRKPEPSGSAARADELLAAVALSRTRQTKLSELTIKLREARERIRQLESDAAKEIDASSAAHDPEAKTESASGDAPSASGARSDESSAVPDDSASEASDTAERSPQTSKTPRQSRRTPGRKPKPGGSDAGTDTSEHVEQSPTGSESASAPGTDSAPSGTEGE